MNEWRNLMNADASVQGTRVTELFDEYENDPNHTLWPS